MPNFAHLGRLLAAGILVLLPMACGGGGTGKAVTAVTTYTIQVNAGIGMRVRPAMAVVEAGKSAVFQVATDAGYTVDSVSGCGGSLQNGVYTTGAIWADGTVQAVAKPLVFTVVTAPGPGAHFSPASAQVEYGKTAAFTINLNAGYYLDAVTGGDGTLTGRVYTTGPMTADATLTCSTYVVSEVPAVAGKIAFVVAPDVQKDLLPLLQAFMSAVSVDTGCESVLVDGAQDPEAIREALKGIGTDLRLAFLIGDIPMVWEVTVSPYGTFKNLSDHYFRALEFPYGSMYLDAMGDAVVEVPSESSILPSTSPTIAVSRIKGLTASSQLPDIRRYLEKNLLLRNDAVRFRRGLHFTSASADGPIDGPKFLAAYLDHPLYTAGEVAFLGKLSARELRQGFLDALGSGVEHCEINLHGGPTSVQFQGLTASDFIDLDSTAFGSASIRAKVVSLASCSTGNFSVEGYFAGQALFSPNSDALLVRANPAVTLYVDSAFAREARSLDMALGAGKSYMETYTTTFPGEPPHFFGDPTIRLRSVDLSGPRAKLVVQKKRHVQPFRDSLSFKTASVNGASIQEELVFLNAGDSPLIIDGENGNRGIDFEGTFPWGVNASIPGFNAPYIYQDPDFQTEMDGRYTFTLAPGERKSIRLEFTPARLSNGTIPVGTYHGVMFFSCNDPEVGSFRLDLSARTN